MSDDTGELLNRLTREYAKGLVKLSDGSPKAKRTADELAPYEVASFFKAAKAAGIKVRLESEKE